MQLLASGFGLLESPRWHAGRLWFSDWTAGEIRKLEADGTSAVLVRHQSLPLCFDFLPDGTLLVVSAATRTLLRAGTDGSLTPVADLTPLSDIGANDIVVDGHGNVYVNSPNAEFGTPLPASGPAPGRIYLVPASGEPRLVARDLAFPNGMAVTADNRTLIVAESYRQRLTAFDIAADGSLSGRRAFADLGDDPPDGITVDAEGAVWYADVPHARCVRVAEGGEVLARVDLDRGAFACMLGGADQTTLYVVGAQWPGAQGPGAQGPGAQGPGAQGPGAEGMSRATRWNGAVWSTPAPAPRSGWPGN